MNAAYEINGQSVSAHDFYASACDPRRPVAVEACAGAGKTWMLVSRIVRALLDGATLQADGRVQLTQAPHEILAITFTKKAAGEMRHRLQQWLEEFAQHSDEKLVDELTARGFAAQQAAGSVGLLRGLYAAVLECQRSVQIRTFHSWFANLLRSAPLGILQELGLPMQYELLEEDTQAVKAVWPRFYAALLEHPPERADYEQLVALHGRHQAHKALGVALSKRVEFGLADQHGVVARSVRRFDEQFPEMAGLTHPDEWLSSDDRVRATFWQAAKNLGSAKASTFSAKGTKLEQALSEGNVDDMVKALFTKNQEARKFGTSVAGRDVVREAQTLMERLLQARLQHEAWTNQLRMTRLTRFLVKCYAELKRERGWVDMNDVELAALALLGEPRLGGWLAQKLDTQVRHLMIDEFQDTNPLQWQALHGWLSGYAGAGGGMARPSLFLVGDPKQSIYRFRRAEPQVFLAAQAFVRNELGGDLLSCDHTRRNGRSIVNAANGVMLQAQGAGQYQGFRAHTTAAGFDGELLALPPIERDSRGAEKDACGHDGAWRDTLTQPRLLASDSLQTLQCRQAARWVLERLAMGAKPQDILVLARKRDRLARMQEALAAVQVAAQQPEKLNLWDAPEVQDVLALVDVLVSPTHDLSLARALKSPLFGFGDEQLVPLAARQRQKRGQAEARGSGHCWLHLICEEPALAGDPTVSATLLRWQEQLQRLPPHDALALIFDEGDVLARFAQAAPGGQRDQVLSNLRNLLAAALQINGSRYATPYGLIRALKSTGVKANVHQESLAVNLLTVHGAKGLEAPWVLLLDTDAPPPNSPSMGVLVDWPGQAPVPQRLVFLANESRPPPCAREMLRAEESARAREELNALYVAMTRAKQGLAASSVRSHRDAPDSWWRYLEPHLRVVDVPDVAQPGAAAGKQSAFALACLPGLGRSVGATATGAVDGPAVLQADQILDAAANELSRVGQAMHRLLEWYRPGQSAFSAAQRAAVAQQFALPPAQCQRAGDMAMAIVQGQGAWVWDETVIDWAANEVNVNWRGDSLRLDRLVHRRDTGQWWVLDYKSAAQPLELAAMTEQLHSYRCAVQDAHPGESVRAAFLTSAGELKELI